MRNFYTPVADTSIQDDSGVSLLDRLGNELLETDAATENVWENESLIAAMFVELRFDEYMYYSTFDIDIYWNANKYEAGDLKAGSLVFQSELTVDKASLKFSNVSRQMSALLGNTDQRGKKVKVSMGAVNGSTRKLYSVEPLYIGELSGWTISGVMCELLLSGLMARWNKKTLRIAQGSCPWPIGGDECGYTGTEDCSQNFGKCSDMGNSENYGGFYALPTMQEKIIYWGRDNPAK